MTLDFPMDSIAATFNSIGSTTVNVIDAYLYTRAQSSGILTADLRDPFTGHGAGSSNNWTFGTHCDTDSLIWAFRLGWSFDCSISCQKEDEAKFDPHPNNAGTCAVAQTIARTLGDSQPSCSTTNASFGSAAVTDSQRSLRTGGGSNPQPDGASNATTLNDLAAACAQKLDAQGFGAATVSGTLQAINETVILPVPCIITLADGASLRLVNSRLTAHNLIVTNNEGLPHAVSLELDNSTLNGVGDAGLLVRFRNPSDRVTVNNSTLDFNLSVWLGAGSGGVARPDGGVIEMNNSTIRSVGPDSQGIQALASAASGRILFNNDRFETSYLDGLALLFAHSCRQNNVTGSIAKCT